MERFDLDNQADPGVLARELVGSWATIAGHEAYGSELFDLLPELCVIARPGVGHDRIDIHAATRNNVAVVFAPGANADAVADHALALILACLKDIPRVDAAVRSGAWVPKVLLADLAGATVGVVGLGDIGRRVARRLAAFDCEILASEPSPDHAFLGAHPVELVDLNSLLRRSAVVTLHVRPGAGTDHLIGRRELSLMSSDAILVNTSRGQVIDEVALVEALEGHAIRGAALDVFEREPLASGHPLTWLENVVLSGHVAGLTEHSIARAVDIVVSSLIEIAAGGRPSSRVVNPQVWAGSNSIDETPTGPADPSLRRRC